MYHTYVDSNDLNTIREYESKLAFGDGKLGEFTYFVFFLPVYLELISKKEYFEYYNTLIKVLGTNNFSKFLKKYKIDLEYPFI